MKEQTLSWYDFDSLTKEECLSNVFRLMQVSFSEGYIVTAISNSKVSKGSVWRVTARGKAQI